MHQRLVLLTTGLRPGEALGLRWEDWEGDRLRVQRSLTRTAKGGWMLAEPKTSRSRRSVTLPSSTSEALGAHRVNQARERLQRGMGYQDDGLVFCTAQGTPLDLPGVTRRHFHPILKAAGLERIRVYDLRHTCATLLLAAGEHPKIVSERLGHASVTLTLDTYSHVLPDMQESAAKKLEGLLFG